MSCSCCCLLMPQGNSGACQGHYTQYWITGPTPAAVLHFAIDCSKGAKRVLLPEQSLQSDWGYALPVPSSWSSRLLPPRSCAPCHLNLQLCPHSLSGKRAYSIQTAHHCTVIGPQRNPEVTHSTCFLNTGSADQLGRSTARLARSYFNYLVGHTQRSIC